MPDPTPPADELEFEQALTKLERIVADMEGGELLLADSVSKFEEGMKLAQHCAGKLGETEKKVEMLMQKAGGTMGWEPFPVPGDVEES